MSEKSSKLKVILPIIIVIPVIAVVLLMNNLEKLAGSILSKALQTNVTVGKINLDIATGNKLSVEVMDIKIANMPGYKESNIMTIGSVKAAGGMADDKSVILDLVSMDKVDIYVEANKNGMNVNDMRSNLKKAGSSAPEKEAKEKSSGDNKIAVKKASFTNGNIHARLIGMEKTIKLPSQTFYNLGTEKKKISYQEAAQQFMKQIMKNASSAATSINVNVDADKMKKSVTEGIGNFLGK